MAIYTRKGDTGYTRLADGTRVSKLHPRVRAVGALDEVNAALGLARSLCQDPEVQQAVARIQGQLFKVGSALSSPRYAGAVDPQWVAGFEQAIDQAEAELPAQTAWILPGDTPGSGALHLARAACRRTERVTLQVVQEEAAAGQADGPEDLGDAGESVTAQVVLPYLNRLSDYLHVLARLEDRRQLIRRIVARVKSELGTRSEAAAAAAGGELTAAQCDQILAAATARAQALGVPMAMAVVDAGGNLMAFRRMDGCLLASVDIAVGKAYTSAALRRSTREVGALAQPGAPLYGIAATHPGRIVCFGGGLPLWRGETLLGGIGVSGGSVEQDEEVARAGLEGLG